ncbi:response regulator [Siccirubricoccus sp. G192]|uniref:response regulator n=1 Tax=Siccirubricoccus sp. G192 TaxID=2849651 RepID=UPI001C2BA844|nr:response regulator [Siccirubricoccus sp. G192]MBV1797069.1 response regulator [Siccirubricoccus sp. G192]
MLRNRRILVVEDEALVAMMVEDELREAGAKILTAATVGNALRLIEAAMQDGGLSAAVLDINLGGEMVTPVADVLARLGVPFLFATGYGEGCDKGGHDAVPMLHKPFEPLDLVVEIKALAPAGDAWQEVTALASSSASGSAA